MRGMCVCCMSASTVAHMEEGRSRGVSHTLSSPVRGALDQKTVVLGAERGSAEGMAGAPGRRPTGGSRISGAPGSFQRDHAQP